MIDSSFFKKIFLKFSQNWFVILTLFVAVVGGIPGILSIYERISDLPAVLISIRRIDYGEVNWPESSALNSKTYILFTLAALNEEKRLIPIPLKSFNMFLDIEGKWTKFEPMFIPSSGTALHETSKHIRGANIDHADLQKYTELVQMHS
ncbi:MAG: hypothetical protein KQH63_21785 [Desulfobulbaceae bacterium]|nr:hypothetical protein [Desulfobulbaceae bacterium]